MQTTFFHKIFLVLFISFSTSLYVSAQQDTTNKEVVKPVRLSALPEKKKYLTAKSIIIPTAFINYGFSSLHFKELQQLNKNISEEVTEDMPGFQSKVDDYLKYAPVASVYALNLVGIKGRHKLISRTIIYAMSSFLANHIVSKIKDATHQLRPDGSTYNSFPSGHTTTAFVGAEFMNQEYGWRSPWYSVAGYTMATGTATLRVMNNRHWVSDVIAGAGIGMLSTKFCYWLYSKWENRKHDNQILNY